MDVYMSRIKYIDSQERVGSIFENVLEPNEELNILHDDGYLVEFWAEASDERKAEFHEKNQRHFLALKTSLF